MLTGAAYIRVSTEEQLEFSPDSQLKKIQEYADCHQIFLPEEFIFVDEGISGRYARKRPSFMRMIHTARQKPKPFDLILVWKFSRFARNRQDSIFYKSMLRKECCIDIISVSEQLGDDATSVLMEAFLEAMDEYYSINLAQEVKRGMNEKFSRGGVVSPPPFGYLMGEDCFKIDPEKAPFVRMMFENFQNGDSCRQIATKLNEIGIRTKRGRLFDSRSVRYILSNPVYIGKLRRTVPLRYNLSLQQNQQQQAIVDGFHSPIVDYSLYLSVQTRLQETDNSILHPPHSSSYMLKGLVRCSCCGSTLTRIAKGKALQCSKYIKGQCPKSHYITLTRLNQLIFSELQKERAGSSFGIPETILSTPGFEYMDEQKKNQLLSHFISYINFNSSKKEIRIIYRH